LAVWNYPTAAVFSELAREINRETLDRWSPNNRAASTALALPELTAKNRCCMNGRLIIPK
jgi:hypothetical protein